MGWFSKSLYEQVFEYLESMRIRSSDFERETELEVIVAERLSRNFEDVHRQFNIEGYLGAKVDIDIQEEVGVEIKLAKQLVKADPVHRLFGQAIYYNRRKYEGELIVLIVGSKEEIETPLIKEVVLFLEEELSVSVIPLSTIKSRS